MITYVRKPQPYDSNKTLYENRIRDRGSMRCHCGAEVDLGFTDVDCDNCGQLYNAGGQRLNPPSAWEEPYDED